MAACVMQKQGIVTILGSELDRNIVAASATSLRRTLSADMSSKKWLLTTSSEQLSHSKVNAEYSLSSSEGEDEQEQFKIWNSIQLDSKEKKNENLGQLDIWSSILSQKANNEASKLSAPDYVHPLVRRSESCLSEKSLEICTESLGSETGSDGFSDEVTVTMQACDDEAPKYNYSSNKSSQRCFPPPLPSLSHQHGGSLLHMRPHRDNGRLFLQAVSVPSQKNFLPQRQDGRLVVTFATKYEDKATILASSDGVEEYEYDYEADVTETVIEKANMLASRITSDRTSSTKCPKWFEESMPKAWMVPYYWRTKPTENVAPVCNNPITREQNNYSSISLKNNISNKLNVVSGNINMKQTSNDPPQSLVLRGKNGDYLVHNFKSCKDFRRSFIFWEPYCIAT